MIGLSNLAVWWIPSLQFVASWPGAMFMRVNTALALSAGALSLLLWHYAGRPARLNRQQWAASLLGAIPALIGGLTSFEYLSGINLGVDTLLAAATFPGDHANNHVVAPGRMSLNAALSLFFLGFSLCGLDWTIHIGRPRRIFIAPIVAVISALPACFGLVGYLSGTGGFTGLLKSTNLLMHAAVALVLLALGVLAVRGERQPVRRILSQGAGGMLLRWLLPGATASLILLAWLIGKARAHAHVAPGEGTALMLFGGLILLYALIVSASRAVDVQEARAQRAKSALHEEELRSRSILATSLDGVLLMDMHGRVRDWNQAAERIFGWRPEEIVGQPLADHIIPERLRAAHNQGLKNYLITGSGPVLGKRLELPALRRDGTEFPVELSINAVTDAEPPLFVGFIRDITERRKAELALREAKELAEKASQAKDDFLAALSHELRTPLTPVLLSASVLSKDARLPEDVRRTLGMIERHVTLEARLIDDLLDLTRISRGKLHLRKEMCDLETLIHHAVEIIKEDAEAKNLTLRLQLTSAAPRLAGDSARLQQVFWNLLKNAVKFTPHSGTITITTSTDEPQKLAQITVQDTGVGFAPDRADQLFLPFEQEKPGTQHQFGGLGLGLAIARAIVSLHGGNIVATSEGPGLGATFVVTLPFGILTEENTPSEPMVLTNGQAVKQVLQILLVEDHEHTRQVLAQLLQRSGHRVQCAGNVEEALGFADSAANPFDILISDLGLPDGSGLDLMQKLRNRGHTLPGIALSGYGMEEDHLRTREVGFACHLVKPVKFEQLTQALASINIGDEPSV